MEIVDVENNGDEAGSPEQWLERMHVCQTKLDKLAEMNWRNLPNWKLK